MTYKPYYSEKYNERAMENKKNKKYKKYSQHKNPYFEIKNNNLDKKGNLILKVNDKY